VAAAKTSFAQVEKDLALLCGALVSDSTVRRLAVNTWNSSVPAQAPASTAASTDASPSVSAWASLVCVDGGMVRLENASGGTQWRQYKALCLNGAKSLSE
jgi:hypothetical protein